MPCLLDNFRSQVFSSSAERVGLLTLIVQKLRKSKISQANVAIFSHKNVLRLEVSVHNIVFVKVSESNCNLGANELYSFFWESPVGEKMVKKVSTFYIVHEKVKPETVLKNEVHSKNKRMISLEQDIFFVPGVFNLLFLYQDVFVYSLHSIQFIVFSVFNKENFSE